MASEVTRLPVLSLCYCSLVSYYTRKAVLNIMAFHFDFKRKIEKAIVSFYRSQMHDTLTLNFNTECNTELFDVEVILSNI